MRKLATLFLTALAILTVEAQANSVERTKYQFYPISGVTPVEIYSAMASQGPHVNGTKAYASISATSSPKVRMLQQGDLCRVEAYQLSINFIISLPKLKNEAALSGVTASKWNQFKSFLKTHEEKHRSIWLSCAKDLEVQVKALRAGDCKVLDRQAAELWKKMRSGCQRQNAAFDRGDQKRLLQHPFVQMVQGRHVSSVKDERALKAY